MNRRKWFCCTTPAKQSTTKQGKPPAVRTGSHGYSSLYISQDLAYSDAMEEDYQGGAPGRQLHMPWQSNMQQQPGSTQPQLQPLLSSSTPDRSEYRPMRHQSGSSSAFYSNHSLITNPEARYYGNPLHSGASTAAAPYNEHRSHNANADSTWIPGALNLRIGANELGQRSQPGTSQLQSVRRNTSDLMTGQSGLTTGAFELGPDVQRAPAAALPQSQAVQQTTGHHTQQADQGVFLSLQAQPDGSNRLLRIRFDRKMYSKRAAEAWWQESKQRVIALFRLSTQPDIEAADDALGAQQADLRERQDDDVQHHMTAALSHVPADTAVVPAVVLHHVDLLQQALQYTEAAIYCQYNCQQLLICACKAFQAVTSVTSSTGDGMRQDQASGRGQGPFAATGHQPGLNADLTQGRRAPSASASGQGTKQQSGPHSEGQAEALTGLLEKVLGLVRVFSQTGWLIRLEGHVDDAEQFGVLFEALQELAKLATNAPDWRNDSEGLWGRLIELGGVAGLHTDSDCLLLKDLCTSGIADDAFLRLVDEEIHEHQQQVPVSSHEVIRHTSMRLFWVRAAGQRQELPWSQFWAAFPSSLHASESTAFMQQAVTFIDNRQAFEVAVAKQSPDFVTAVDLDMAFPPGLTIADCFHRLIESSKLQSASANGPNISSAPKPESLIGLRNRKRKRAADVEAGLATAGFWTTQQITLPPSFRQAVTAMEEELTDGLHTQQSSPQPSLQSFEMRDSMLNLPDGPQGCLGVALTDHQGSDIGVLASALAGRMLQNNMWSAIAYADLTDVDGSVEAASRVATSLGITSYPVKADDILGLHCCLQARSASAGCLGLVVDLSQLTSSVQTLDSIMAMLSYLLLGTSALQIVALMPEEGRAPQQPFWRTCPGPQLDCEEAQTMLSRSLKNVHVTAAELGLLEQACEQQPWLLDVAAKALSQGSVSQQQLLNFMGSDVSLMTSSLAKQLPQQLLQQLPAWLLQLLTTEDWQSLMCLAIFPAAFSLKDAAHVLPSTLETTQIQTKMLHLQRLGLMRYNSAHKLFSLQPPLRPVLLDVVQQQPDMYSHAVLGLAQCCMEACSLASAVFASHAQVAALHLVNRCRSNLDTLLRAVTDGLPAKALPLIIQLISQHMEPLAFRLSAEQQQQLCSSVGQAAEASGDVLGEVECALQLGKQGHWEQAQTALAGALPLVEKALGPSHPSVAKAATCQAGMLMQQHQPDQALVLLQDCMSLQEHYTGADQPQAADTLRQMASAMQAQGQHEEAEQVLRQCLAIQSHAQGSHHPKTGHALHDLAACLQSLHRYQEAEGLFKQAEKCLKQALGQFHPALATLLVDWASAQAQNRSPQQAQQLLRRSVDMWHHMDACAHPGLQRALAQLASLLEGQGDDKALQAVQVESRALADVMAAPLSSQAHAGACVRLSHVQKAAAQHLSQPRKRGLQAPSLNQPAGLPHQATLPIQPKQSRWGPQTKPFAAAESQRALPNLAAYASHFSTGQGHTPPQPSNAPMLPGQPNINLSQGSSMAQPSSKAAPNGLGQPFRQAVTGISDMPHWGHSLQTPFALVPQSSRGSLQHSHHSQAGSGQLPSALPASQQDLLPSSNQLSPHSQSNSHRAQSVANHQPEEQQIRVVQQHTHVSDTQGLASDFGMAAASDRGTTSAQHEQGSIGTHAGVQLSPTPIFSQPRDASESTEQFPTDAQTDSGILFSLQRKHRQLAGRDSLPAQRHTQPDASPASDTLPQQQDSPNLPPPTTPAAAPPPPQAAGQNASPETKDLSQQLFEPTPQKGGPEAAGFEQRPISPGPAIAYRLTPRSSEEDLWAVQSSQAPSVQASPLSQRSAFEMPNLLPSPTANPTQLSSVPVLAQRSAENLLHCDPRSDYREDGAVQDRPVLEQADAHGSNTQGDRAKEKGAHTSLDLSNTPAVMSLTKQQSSGTTGSTQQHAQGDHTSHRDRSSGDLVSDYALQLSKSAMTPKERALRSLSSKGFVLAKTLSTSLSRSLSRTLSQSLQPDVVVHEQPNNLQSECEAINGVPVHTNRADSRPMTTTPYRATVEPSMVSSQRSESMRALIKQFNWQS